MSSVSHPLSLTSSSRRYSSSSPLLSSPSPSALPRNSHYRTFSTLYAESPYVEIHDKGSLLRPQSSIAGLQAFVHMGIGFKDKLKAKQNDAESTPTPTQVLVPPNHKWPSDTPTLRRVGKKRSMTPATDHFTTTSMSTKKKTRAWSQDHESPERFIPKSIWAKRHNMKLHPYHQDVPYMQAYDPIILESDRYSDLLLRRLNHGYPSFHNYGKNPPATVLDLGCGPGHWVLHAATVWKTSQITGLDLVDLALPGFETTENANFVLGNFVAFDLPFPDNSIDYVRMANLVLCIPYERWDYVLREIHRVLTVHGRMELIDDQIFFPYAATPSFSSSQDMLDAFDDADFDDKETLQGSLSDVGSTLNANSESSNSSCEDQIFDSPTLRPIASYQSPMPTRSSSFVHTESRHSSWRAQATASRELESIFEIMLKKKYKIFPRPSDFILNRLEGIFGKEAAGKTRSYHVKLAPIDSADAQGKADGENSGGTMKKMAWMGMDREKFSKKKVKKASKAETGSGGSSSERSSLENSTPSSTVSPSPSTNVNAAGRLGMSFGPMDRVPLLSAKAAGRLGISYSDLAAAAATVASTPHQPHASPSSPLQSPGLLVWPSTFIPVTPVELEMHANKYVHTLLGCKPALAEFIAQFTNEDGTRFVDEDEFHDIVWQYECFRRSRFNWPSEIPDPYDDESTTPTPIFNPPPQKSKSNKNNLDLYSGEELTHIRTIRVFEATKSDWLFSSLFLHRQPATL